MIKDNDKKPLVQSKQYDDYNDIMTIMIMMTIKTNLWCNPSRMIHLSFLLEAELGVGHVYPANIIMMFDVLPWK